MRISKILRLAVISPGILLYLLWVLVLLVRANWGQGKLTRAQWAAQAKLISDNLSHNIEMVEMIAFICWAAWFIYKFEIYFSHV